ncbi:hypothetical protein M9Y10_032501 [Tritrichomonas musculus]|uniref:beta-galactosidase n=1 Tax=Tritrichomonas musculus TaxID=1915356 RepID=A0ABR2GYN2_9EUKA
MLHIDYYKIIKSVAVNKEEPRTSFVSHDDRDEAITNITNFENSPYYINLNGKWEFYFNEYPRDVPKDIATDTNNDDPKWCEINVPGNWEIQGYGVAVYTDTAYDFCPINPHPPDLPDKNPVGVYRKKDVKIPQKWIDDDRDIFLQVGAAKTGLYVYVNGQEVGYSEDSKDPADFLINKYINKKEEEGNVITFVIYKYTTGSYLEDQDMWRLGGIERDVVLYSQPKTHIRDFKVISTLDNGYSNGIFKLTVNAINHNDKEKVDVNILYELIDNDGKTILQNEEDSSIESMKENVIQFDEQTIQKVNRWSAEDPCLYKLLITLKKKSDNSVLEIVSFRIGFRKEEFTHIKWNNNDYTVLLFNGKPVIYKGVNIHEHDQNTGHYVTDEVRLKDIELLKQNNFNALRFSHYPNCRRLYEMCDEYGFYVVSECNIESHGMGYDFDRTLGNAPIWYEPHIDRTKNMYERTKNYACVTFFSLGNESGNGCNFHKTYKYIKENEMSCQNRPVNYDRALMDWNSDMLLLKFPTDTYLKEVSEKSHERPVMPSEYSHSMGNSNGNFNRIWEAIYDYPNIQGGFIWDWVDQGILTTGKGGRKYWAYGGDFGENTPSDGNFNINGCVNPDRTPHPAMAEIKYSQQNVGFEFSDVKNGIIRIINRFFFTDLNDYEIICSISANEKVIKEINLSNKSNDIQELKPQGSIKVDLHNEINQLKPEINTEYFLNLKVLAKTDKKPFIPKGFEIAHDQFRLPIEPIYKTFKLKHEPKLDIKKTDTSVTITSENVKFEFNTTEGVVKSYQVDGFEFIKDGFGLQPNFWRAPNDNDYGNGGPLREQIWKKMSHNFEVEKFHISSHKCFTILTVNYQLSNHNKYEVVYHIYTNGIVKVDVSYNHSKKMHKEPLPNIPRVGLRFRVPSELHNVIYFGRGPEENYADRCSGTRIDLFKTTAENLYFPYVRPQENGHHVDTRWLAVHNDDNSKGLLIDADKLIEFNALRNSVEDFDSEDQKNLPYQFHNFDKKPPEEAKNILRRHQHIDDIVPRDYVEINVDYKQQGVAGFNSWGDRVLPEFSLPSNQNYSYGFTLIPFNNEDEISEKLSFSYE